jgi:hypothetical protein
MGDGMALQNDAELEQIMRSVIALPDIESAVTFVVRQGSLDLRLAAAAGIEGPALDRLVAAVRDPSHPIARTMTDDGPTFDVQPTAPGGPALRSHLPLVAEGDATPSVIGVLAVAHDRPLAVAERQDLIALAARAASVASASQ